MFNKINILKLFFEEPTREFNVREVARIVKISPATASKELKGLVKKRMLHERKERMLNLYKADLESDACRDLKIYYNICKMKSSNLIESLNNFYLKPVIILFGSCASGTDTETSDFDLLVISEKTKEFPDIKSYEKKLNRKLQLFVVRDVKDLKNEHLINNVLNGMSVQGKIKWI
ncbi:nucleotidyltransferase domain-containing protein [Candidatus Woesearchaeota archaeon]|nr:nucleotidyltransferase domain-containing protein [Candidatus Woesearchaeota archaeon]